MYCQSGLLPLSYQYDRRVKRSWWPYTDSLRRKELLPWGQVRVAVLLLVVDVLVAELVVKVVWVPVVGVLS